MCVVNPLREAIKLSDCVKMRPRREQMTHERSGYRLDKRRCKASAGCADSGRHPA